MLSPGVTTEWPIGVTTAVTQLDSLRVRISLPNNDDNELERHLSISLRGCPVAWTEKRCPEKILHIAPMTTAAALAGRSLPLALADRTVPKDVNLLLGVTLDDSAGRQLQGETTLVRVQVESTGTPGNVRTIGGELPTTGVGLLRALLTGIAAVAAGLFLAGLGRRHSWTRRS